MTITFDSLILGLPSHPRTCRVFCLLFCRGCGDWHSQTWITSHDWVNRHQASHSHGNRGGPWVDHQIAIQGTVAGCDWCHHGKFQGTLELLSAHINSGNYKREEEGEDKRIHVYFLIVLVIMTPWLIPCLLFLEKFSTQQSLSQSSCPEFLKTTSFISLHVCLISVIFIEINLIQIDISKDMYLKANKKINCPVNCSPHQVFQLSLE